MALLEITALLEREGRMGYRQHFDPPAFMGGPHTTQDWLNWMISENVLHEVAPLPERSCGLCGGPVGVMHDGKPFPRCIVCRSYGNVIDSFVPASYSLDIGLESMLHMYKDWPNYTWLGLPLGSLFFARSLAHRTCIESRFGAIDVAVPVPSDNINRYFDHLRALVCSVATGETLLPWNWDTLKRNRNFPRPPRRTLYPEAYEVRGDAIRGRRVLLFDDTWTSGSSIASSAAVLKSAGARSVVATALGRQLKTDGQYYNTQEIISAVRARRWGVHCVLCHP